MRARILLAPLLSVAMLTTTGASARPGIRAVAARDAAPLLDDPQVVVLDVRTAPEVAQARLPGELVHLDFHAPDFAQRIAQLDREATYLLYCRSGQRSGHTRTLMAELDFVDVVDIRGGLIEWVDEGLPIAR